ncbi:MAG: membrane protein insertase YidC [Alphaproteobacteria bacterium]|nr:membrane protein insertase YidC [Alphaproteobacteria bacterium]MCD8525602.1 membrane protein insertase YidC [Alphaproteobacteria bacterium]MCD8571614.1 membrane protein insertase YidC [Alphaproteobacteria bacterium]
MQNTSPKKGDMHPQDLRNLLIFAVASLLLWTLYEAFILKPAGEAMKRQQTQQEQVITGNKEGSTADIPMLDRDDAIARAPRVPFGNDVIKGSLSLKGGRIDDVALLQYFETLQKKDPIVLLSPKDTTHPRHLEFGWVASGDAAKSLSVPGPDTIWRVQGGDRLTADNNVTLVWDSPQGLRFEKEFSIDNRYMMTLTQRVVNTSGRTVSLSPYGIIHQTGIPKEYQGSWILHEGPVGWVGDKLEEAGYKDFRETPRMQFEAANGWAGFTEKYWLVAIAPQQGKDVTYRFNGVVDPADPKDVHKTKYQIDTLVKPESIAPGGTSEVEQHIFLGAKEVITLQGYGKSLGIPNFDMAVDFGWFWFMTKPFFYILHFFHGLVGNFGVAIILLTLVIRTAVFPLTNLSYKSFAKMKKVNPQIGEIRKECGDDRALLQKKIIELYSREGVNPMAGCFPILLQIPIFFALYKVLFGTIEMRHAPFFGWIDDLSAPDPTNIFNLFGLIPFDPPSFFHVGAWPCFMLVGMLIQKQLNPPPQDKLQKDMMLIFPFAITLVMAKFAAGLVIYWTVSALVSITQQMFIMYRLGVPIYLFGQKEDEDAAPKEGEPDVHPLAAMAEAEAEKALFGDEEEGSKPVISKPKPRRKKKK